MAASGRDPALLSFFWALASDEATIRQVAAGELVQYVLKSSSGEVISSKQQKKQQQSLSEDAEYTISRLVKGLASSRDSARRGFAAALCELLIQPAFCNSIVAKKILSIVDKNSQLTSSIRGAEERDFMFCKLFAVLSLLRSECCASDALLTCDLMDRLLELHARKGWIKESCTEALLLLLQQQCQQPPSTATTAATIPQQQLLLLQEKLLPKVLALFGDVQRVSELAAWQLLLLIGLQQLSQQFKDSFGAVFSLLLQQRQHRLPRFEIIDLPAVKDTMLAATAGYPKVHQVWQYLMSYAVGFDMQHRTLPSKRLRSLSAAQENSLLVLLDFLESAHFCESSSHEKRSVGIFVIAQLARLSAPDTLPLILTQVVVQQLKSASRNKTNVLYPVATEALKEMVRCTEDDLESRLALTSALVLQGGADFDTVTGTATLSQLLSGLSYNALAAQVQMLVGAVAAYSGSNSNSSDYSREEEDVEEEEDSAVYEKRALAAIDAICQLVRTASKVEGKGNLCLTVTAVLMRLSCFGPGQCTSLNNSSSNNDGGGESKKKKKSKQQQLSANSSVISSEAAECIRLLDSAPFYNKTSEASSVATFYPQSVVRLAGQRLLSLLADYSCLPAAITTIASLNNDTTAAANNAVAAVATPVASMSLLRAAWETLQSLRSAGVPFAAAATAGYSIGEGDTRSDFNEIARTISQLLNNEPFNSSGTGNGGSDIAAAATANAADGKKSSGLQRKLCSCLETLLVLLSCHHIVSGTSDDTSLETLTEIIPSLLQLGSSAAVSESNRDQSDADDDSSNSSGNSEALQRLLEVSLEVLSIGQQSSGDKTTAATAVVYSSKGTREAVRRLWQSVFAITAGKLTAEVIDGIVAAVTGEESSAQDDASSAGDDAEEDDEEEDKDDAAKTTATTAAASRKRKSSATAEDDEEDIILSEEDALLMLNESDDDNSSNGDGEQMLQHRAELDGALAHMLNMKQQARKQGLLRAQKHALLVRLRAMDLLETLLQRVDSGLLLFPTFLPLLRCLRSAYNSTAVQSMAEGTSYTQRLHALIEQKLCKKKIVLRVSDTAADGCSEEDVLEAFSPLLELLLKLLNSPLPPLRQLAQVAFTAVARTISSSEASSSVDLLVQSLRSAVVDFATRKSSRITAKFVEDVFVQRLAAFAVQQQLWRDALLPALGNASSAYLQMELVRIAAAALKLAGGLPSPVQQQLLETAPLMLQNLSGVLKTIATPTKATATTAATATAAVGWPMKRLKPMFGYVKDVSDYLQKATAACTEPQLSADHLAALIDSVTEFAAAVAILDSSSTQSIKSKKSEKDEKEESSDKNNWNQSSGKVPQMLQQVQSKLQLLIIALQEKQQLSQQQHKAISTPKQKKRRAAATDATTDADAVAVIPQTAEPSAKKSKKQQQRRESA